MTLTVDAPATDQIAVPDPGMVKAFLRGIHNMRGLTIPNAPQPWMTRSVEGVIHDRGRPWIAQQLPERYDEYRLIAERQMCYSNTWMLVMFERSLRYVEGFALSRGGAIPVMHCWAVDQQDRVVDITWDDPGGAAYYGVVISKPVVRTAQRLTGLTGFLASDYMIGHPVRVLNRIPRCWEIRVLYKEKQREQNHRHK